MTLSEELQAAASLVAARVTTGPPPILLRRQMIPLLALTAALVAVCCALGQGLLALFGWREWRPWSPALGFAVLLIVFGQVVRIPNRQGIVIALVLVAAALALALRPVRVGLLGAGRDLLPLGL